ncbi:MAG: flavin reductase family protein [Parvularcula sp.]
MPDQYKDIKNAFARFATGVTVVSCQPPEGPAVAMTVNSFSSVSLDPPLVLWCVDRQSSTYDHFLASDSYAVSILAADQEALSHRFSTPGNHELLPNEGERKKTGSPLLVGRLAGFDCRIDSRHQAGDHWILVGRVEYFDSRDGAPLIYSGRTYLTGPAISD